MEAATAAATAARNRHTQTSKQPHTRHHARVPEEAPDPAQGPHTSAAQVDTECRRKSINPSSDQTRNQSTQATNQSRAAQRDHGSEQNATTSGCSERRQPRLHILLLLCLSFEVSQSFFTLFLYRSIAGRSVLSVSVETEPISHAAPVVGLCMDFALDSATISTRVWTWCALAHGFLREAALLGASRPGWAVAPS